MHERARAAGDIGDRLLLGLAATVAALAAALLLHGGDLFVAANGRAADGPAVARLDATTNDVRRRPRDLPVWDAAHAAQPLQRGDSVFSGGGASAAVTFAGGSHVELGENTLVIIERVEDRPVLNVIRGSLRAEVTATDAPGGAALSFKIAGRPELVRPALGTALRLRLPKAGGAELSVERGLVQVGHATVAAAERAQISGAGAVTPPTRIAVSLDGPGDDARLAAAPRLAWHGPARGATVEVAVDAAFATLAHHAAVSGRTYQLPPLPVGRYYWRVRYPETAETSDDRRFTLDSAGAPGLYQPGSGQELLAVAPEGGAAPGVAVQLRWEALTATAAYDVEVAAEPGFTRRLHAATTERTTLTTPELGAGRYYWRVRAAGAPWSVAGAFSVRVVGPPAAPVPALPGDGATSVMPDAGATGVRLSWGARPEARAYTVEIAAAGAPPLRRDVAGAELTWRPSAPGDYQWRVSAKDAYGRRSSFSATRLLRVTAPAARHPAPLSPPRLPRKLQILLPQRTPGAAPGWLRRLEGLVVGTAYADEIGAAAPAGDVAWPAVPGARSYRVEVGSRPDFAELSVETDVADPVWTVTGLTAGRYYLRVAARGEDGVLGPYSEPSELVVRRQPAAPPALGPPGDGARLEAPPPAARVSLQWQGGAGAHEPPATFTLQVASDPEFRHLVVQRQTQNLRTTVELLSGTYYWRLRADRSATEPGLWSRPWQFTVVLVAPPGSQADAGAPRSASAPAPKPLAAAATPLPGAGRVRLAVGVAPSSFHAVGTAPRVRIDAVLFDSVQASARVRLAGWAQPEVTMRRAATVLFRTPQGSSSQPQVRLAPYLATAAVRLRYGDDAHVGALYLDLKPGVAWRTIERWRAGPAGTLALEEQRVHGASLGAAAGTRLSDVWGVRFDADGTATAAGGAGGWLALTASREVPGAALALDAGVAYERARDPGADAWLAALVVGLGLRL